MPSGTPHPEWLHPPIPPWRLRLPDLAVYLIILTAAGGASAWGLRWIPPVLAWGAPLRHLTRPGHTAALVLSGHGPGEPVILNTWPWVASCILVNALLLWGPLLLLRSPRVPPLPVALWTATMVAVTAAVALGTGWSPAG